jgi:hypothetical protein
MAAGPTSLTERRAEEIYDENMALISEIAESDGDLAQQLLGDHV